MGVVGGQAEAGARDLVLAADIGLPAVSVGAAAAGVDAAPARTGVEPEARGDEIGRVAAEAPELAVDAFNGLVGDRTGEGELLQVGLGLGAEAPQALVARVRAADEAADPHVAEQAAGVDAAVDRAVVGVGGAVEGVGEGAVERDGPGLGHGNGEGRVDDGAVAFAAEAEGVDLGVDVAGADRPDAVLGQGRGGGERGHGGRGEEERFHGDCSVAAASGSRAALAAAISEAGSVAITKLTENSDLCRLWRRGHALWRWCGDKMDA